MGTRDEQIDKLAEQLKEWGKKIDSLQEKAVSMTSEAKVELIKVIDNLKSKKNDLQQKLNSFKESGNSAWDDIKGGFTSAKDDLKGAIDKAINKFKE